MENKELLRSVRRVRNASEYFRAVALLFITPSRVPRQVLNLKLYEIRKNFIKFRSVNGWKLLATFLEVVSRIWRSFVNNCLFNSAVTVIYVQGVFVWNVSRKNYLVSFRDRNLLSRWTCSRDLCSFYLCFLLLNESTHHRMNVHRDCFVTNLSTRHVQSIVGPTFGDESFDTMK